MWNEILVTHQRYGVLHDADLCIRQSLKAYTIHTACGCTSQIRCYRESQSQSEDCKHPALQHEAPQGKFCFVSLSPFTLLCSCPKLKSKGGPIAASVKPGCAARSTFPRVTFCTLLLVAELETEPPQPPAPRLNMLLSIITYVCVCA